jgi:disulfide bond formation protein DsbB
MGGEGYGCNKLKVLWLIAAAVAAVVVVTATTGGGFVKRILYDIPCWLCLHYYRSMKISVPKG